MVWLPRQFQIDGLQSLPFKTNFLMRARTSEAETLVSKKAECLLAIRKDKKLHFHIYTRAYLAEGGGGVTLQWDMSPECCILELRPNLKLLHQKF